MRSSWALLALALLTTAAFAGCADKTPATVDGPVIGADGKVDEDAVSQEITVKATATTGVIRGVVVDSAIRPIAKAIITLQTQEKLLTANTTINGAFGFQDLKPGTYFLKASRAGYTGQQVSAEVVAGNSEPPVVKIQLVADASYVTPYFTVNSYKGFIQCGGAVAAPGVISLAAAICGIPNDACVGGVLGTPCVVTGPKISDDVFSAFITLEKPPTYIQGEVVWDSTQAAGSTLSVAVRSSTSESHAQGQYVSDINGSAGPSPLKFSVGPGDMVEHDMGVNGTGLELDMFTGRGVCDPAGAGCEAGLTVNQSFQVITHFFYGFRPPADWLFTVNGDPVPPHA